MNSFPKDACSFATPLCLSHPGIDAPAADAGKGKRVEVTDKKFISFSFIAEC